MKRIIVVGAGASGLMAAITAAKQGASVTLLEGSEKPGKKILITGNGRCNLTNTDFSRKDCYRSDSGNVVDEVLQQFSYHDTITFFEKIGLLTQNRNGGVYPVTDQASSVLEILLSEAARLKIKMKCREKVISVQKQGQIWKVATQGWSYEADRVILSCGSRSYPATGSDGSGYRIAEELKMKIIEPVPALVPLMVKESWVKKISGVRSNANVTLKITDDNKRTISYTESGEVQWTDYGVSGIVIFQLSRYAVKAIRDKRQAILTIELLPDLNEKELYDFLQKRNQCRNYGEMLTGILPKKMIPVILERTGLKSDESCTDMDNRIITDIISGMKKLHLHISGSKSFDMAQVCAGGISLSEVDLKTMQSKKHEGLFITGEILDVDGICGGYNLQWAWSSGYIAGKASVE